MTQQTAITEIEAAITEAQDFLEKLRKADPDVLRFIQAIMNERDALRRESDLVMTLLDERGAAAISYLMDSDDNPGERLRALIRRGPK